MAAHPGRIRRPLRSGDTEAAIGFARSLGVRVEDEGVDSLLLVPPVDGLRAAGHTVDVANSGTTLYLAAAVAACLPGTTRFTGDEQIRRRSAGPLLAALRELGAGVSELGEPGCAPFEVTGPLEGGRVQIDCPTSQYLSAILLAAPRARGPVQIEVGLLNERPYVDMTIDWMQRQGVEVDRRGYESFTVRPGTYAPVDAEVPADWSSAAFPLLAAVTTGCELRLTGLDPADRQGDKEIVAHLRSMGADIAVDGDSLRVARRTGPLRPVSVDLNATPDTLPALAVAACFAQGASHLANVPQARIKETDRIAVMARELSGLGLRVSELEDGLVVHGSGSLPGGRVESHGDHRVAMAFAAAALAATGPLTIGGSECASITYPGFYEELERLRR